MATSFEPIRGAVPLIVAPHPDAELWPEETTVVGRTPHFSQPEADADNGGSLRLVALGDADTGLVSNWAVQLGVERGGPPGTAALWWSDAAGPTKYGWDPPIVSRRHDDILASNLADVGGFDVAPASDGALVAVVATNATAGSGTLLTMYARPNDGSTWDARGFALPASSLSGSYYPANYGIAPVLVPGEDGALFLLVQRHQQAGGGAIASRLDVYRAPADYDWNGGTDAGFDLWAADAVSLGTGVTRAHAVGAPMRAATANGQALLVLCATAVSPPTFRQYASADGMATFELVEDELVQGGATSTVLWNPTDRFDVGSCAGFLLVAVVVRQQPSGGGTEYTRVKVRRVGSAFDNLDYAEVIDVGFANDLARADGHPPRFSVDEDGTLRIFVDCTDGTRVATSGDAGKTWSEAQALVHEHANATRWCAAAAWRSRTVLALTCEDTSGYEGSLVSYDLGGYTTHPQPREPSDALSGGTGRLPWSGTLEGGVDPAGPSWADYVGVGSPAFSVQTDPLAFRVTCGAADEARVGVQSADWTPAWTPSVRRVGASVVPTAGTVIVRCTSNTKGLLAEWTSTGVVIKDAVSGTALATVASAQAEVVLWIDEVNGKGFALTRSNLDENTPYVAQVSNVSLTSGAIAEGGWVYWGNNTTGELWRFRYAVHQPQYTFAPTVPYGRPFNGMPIHVANGLSVQAVDGTGIVGDQFTVTLASDFGPERAAWTGDWPSPRDRLELATLGTEGEDVVAYKLASTVQHLDTRLWVAVCEGPHASLLQWHNGTSWGSDTTVHGPRQGRWTAAGRVARPFAAGFDPVFVEEDELAGGYLVSEVSSLGDGVAIKILGNTAGSFHAPASGTTKLATLRLAKEASGTFQYVQPPRAVTVMDSERIPATATGYRLMLVRIAQTIYDGDVDASGTHVAAPYQGAGKVLVGPAIALGHPHGRNTLRTYQADHEDMQTEDGRRWGLDPQAPPETTLRVSWQDVADVHLRHTREAGAPDYIVDSQGVPIFAAGEQLSTLQARLTSWKRSRTPVGLVRRWEPASGSNAWWRLRANGTLVGTVESAWTDEHTGNGDEQHDELARGGELVLRELV